MMMECNNCPRKGRLGDVIRKYRNGGRILYLCWNCYQLLKKEHIHMVDAFKRPVSLSGGVGVGVEQDNAVERTPEGSEGQIEGKL